MSLRDLYEELLLVETVGRGSPMDFPKSGRAGQTYPLKMPEVKTSGGRDRFYALLKTLGIISPEMGSSYAKKLGAPERKVYPIPGYRNVALVVVDRGRPELRTRDANDRIPQGVIAQVTRAAGVGPAAPKIPPAGASAKVVLQKRTGPKRGRKSAVEKLMAYLDSKPGAFTMAMKKDFHGEIAKVAGMKATSVAKNPNVKRAAGQLGDGITAILRAMRARQQMV